MVDFARIATLDHQARAGAQPSAHHLMMQTRAGKERGDRRHLGIDTPVGQDDHTGPLLDRRARFVDQGVSAASSPSARSAALKVMATVATVNPRQSSNCLSRARSSLSRIGMSSAI